MQGDRRTHDDKSRDARPEFGKLMKVLLPGDTVVVTKLDRLARSSRDLHNILHDLKGLSVGFRSLGEAGATRLPTLAG
jgi:DNA invertase Pin-like site-specific DNA recombinase